MSEAWPGLEWEQREWRPVRRFQGSRTQQRKHQGPYDAAVPPSIAGQDLQLPGEVVAEAEESAIAVARFDADVAATLDTHGSAGGSELGPMSSILLRSESASSSQIENLTVGSRQLALAEIGELAGPNARVVSRNVAAMHAALAMSERIDADAIVEMHRTLLPDSPHAGGWREEQVWIGGGAAGPHTAEFVPPHHSRVPAGIADLVAFIERDDLPVLAQAAIAHAQFETIHPFTDGNGRTGRALLHAMLRSKGVTTRLTVPVSAGLLTDTAAYFRALGDYRRGDPASVVQQISQAALIAIDHGRELVDELVGIRAAWRARIAARRDAAVWRLPDLLMRHPVVNNGLVARELDVSDVTAQSAIDHLVAIGALVSSDNKTRNRVWQAGDVLDALDGFAERSGRRRTAG